MGSIEFAYRYAKIASAHASKSLLLLSCIIEPLLKRTAWHTQGLNPYNYGAFAQFCSMSKLLFLVSLQHECP